MPEPEPGPSAELRTTMEAASFPSSLWGPTAPSVTGDFPASLWSTTSPSETRQPTAVKTPPLARAKVEQPASVDEEVHTPVSEHTAVSEQSGPEEVDEEQSLPAEVDIGEVRAWVAAEKEDEALDFGDYQAWAAGEGKKEETTQVADSYYLTHHCDHGQPFGMPDTTHLDCQMAGHGRQRLVFNMSYPEGFPRQKAGK